MELDMYSKGTIDIVSGKTDVKIPIKAILYVRMEGNDAFIRLSDGENYRVRMTLSELEGLLGNDFIKVKRGCLVSVMAIHDITDKVNLSNGESLDYAQREKKEILAEFHAKQGKIIREFNKAVDIGTQEEYHEHYRVFDKMPFAFADIEMVFDDKNNAVDWIFRYGNDALAELEKVPLENMVGNSFATIFPNMDVKWLRTYERTVLFGETLKIIDYSHEIDAYLDIICFPTFKGHCGCILFDISKITSFRNSTDAEKALSFFFAKLLN